MDTSNFKESVNVVACQVEDTMRSICGVQVIGRIGPPLTQAEYQQMMNLVAISGRDGFAGSEQEKIMLQLIKRYVENGGKDPRVTPAPEQPATQGSLATGTIDNWYDALNWIKGSLVIMMGAAAHPKLIVPTQIGIVLSLAYALRKHIYITRKINFKFSIR